MSKRRHTASRLRHRLTLQQEVRTPDEAGGYVRSWQALATLWAEIIPAAGNSGMRDGREVFFAGQIQSEISHRIILRYREGVTPGMRLSFEGRAFNIRYVVSPQEKAELLELLVEEGVAD